jgi:hypothetical protein
MKDFFCEKCGAPARQTSRRADYDVLTGELKAYWIHLRCSAHPILHNTLTYKHKEDVYK